MVKKIKVALKLLISIALIYFVIKQIDYNRLLLLLKSSNLLLLFLAFILFNISKIISAVRLNWYFKEIDVEIEERNNIVLYYVGMFYNLFLPGGIGGDGYKALLIKRMFNVKVTPIFKALLLDRVSGLIALIFLASLLFMVSDYAIYPITILAIIVAILIYPIFYLVSKRYNIFIKYFNRTTILGLLVQIFQLLSAIAIIYALPQSSHLVEFLVLFLISSVVAVLPITIGGVGVRELTFLYGLGYIGVGASLGVAFSFIFFLITLLSSLIGILFLNRPMGED